MAMTMNMEQNMGVTDRWVRGALGSAMLMHGMRHRPKNMWNRLESLLGGAFLVYGVTGFDPLLKLFGASTHRGAENNVMNKVKEAMPSNGQAMQSGQSSQNESEMTASSTQPNRQKETTRTAGRRTQEQGRFSEQGLSY